MIAKSFARIHETNLKKQGILPLKFRTPSDYDKIKEDDRVTIRGLKELSPDKPLRMTVTHADKSTESVELAHSFTSEQIEWFKAGSALNLMRNVL